MNSATPTIFPLPELGTVFKTSQHILFLARQPLLATGSCIWNGGSALVNGWLNLKVSGDTNITESPQSTLQHYANTLGQFQPFAGMMTAASMNSLCIAQQGDAQKKIACIVTAGIENARRVGDRADATPTPGTINVALICNQFLTPAARIEALMTLTEAKTAACYDLNIMSPRSGKIATGTGTDSICVLSAAQENTDPVIEYCGKHTQWGEWIGQACYEAIYSSLRACVDLRMAEGAQP